MQNGRADRIERSVAILSPNGVCHQVDLLPVLATPILLGVHTKVISTSSSPLHDIICGTPCHFVSCPYTLSQAERHAADSFCRYNRAHPHVIPITTCRQIPDFPVCKLKSTHRPCFQSHCSVRAPPIYPHLLVKRISIFAHIKSRLI